jgi:hypothetical protein
MRSFLRAVLRACVALAVFAALLYAADDFWALHQGRPTEKVKVDRIYADLTHWNYVEYSVGTPVVETCLDALMPHFGYTPCWYLRRHTMRQIGP